jgi:hypothetical protein
MTKPSLDVVSSARLVHMGVSSVEVPSAPSVDHPDRKELVKKRCFLNKYDAMEPSGPLIS